MRILENRDAAIYTFLKTYLNWKFFYTKVKNIKWQIVKFKTKQLHDETGPDRTFLRPQTSNESSSSCVKFAFFASSQSSMTLGSSNCDTSRSCVSTLAASASRWRWLSCTAVRFVFSSLCCFFTDFFGSSGFVDSTEFSDKSAAHSQLSLTTQLSAAHTPHRQLSLNANCSRTQSRKQKATAQWRVEGMGPPFAKGFVVACSSEKSEEHAPFEAKVELQFCHSW